MAPSFPRFKPRPSAVILLTMLQRLFRAAIPVFCLMAVSPFASACRYSVRDVGFVEIAPMPYRLLILGAPPADSEERVSDWITVSRLALAGSNVTVEAASEGASFSARFESPDPEIRPLSLETSDDPASEAWRATLETLVSSKVRERYLERMLDLYGMIVWVPSGNEKADAMANAAIEEAVTRSQDLMTRIPKPVNEPPEVVTIPNDGSERILLWSLGIEDRALPHVAVLFGCGRRIGDVLTGEEITSNRLFEILSVIGLDCECGLDRSWMQGTLIPLRWNEGTRERTARALDFDPENPVVKMEISQILAQGGLGTRRVEGVDSDPFFGYTEKSVSFRPLDFGMEGAGTDSELAPDRRITAPALPPVAEGEARPSGMAPFPTPGAGDSPGGWPLFSSMGVLISLGLSIFAVGFYILFRARRLEP